LLHTVSKADVRQPSGRIDHNSGEIAPEAVTMIIEQFGSLSVDDVFLDVGSGVGNVILQVALQSSFRQCVGIEKREELADITQKVLVQHMQHYPRLGSVVVIAGDITTMDFDTIQNITNSTHLYCSNKVFTTDALLALEDMCLLPKLKKVVMTDVPCPRHKQRCNKQFCHLWTLVCKIAVPVTYTDTKVDFFFFDRNLEHTFV
jgi:tRNA G46 methylase TrmB